MVDNIDEGENEKDTMVAGATDVIARLGVSPNQADCVVQTTWLKYIFAVLKHLLVFGKNIFHNFGHPFYEDIGVHWYDSGLWGL